jgi:hypothetical protein
VATFLVVLGLGFELAGIGLAVSGVVAVGDELFPGLRFPHRRAVAWVGRVIRRKGQHRQLAVADAATATGVARLRAQGVRGRPSEDAPLDEWNAYWESRINNLGQRLDWVVEDMQQADAENTRRITEEARQRETAITRLEERLLVVVGGDGGRGLVRTWWGLILIGCGAFLQVFGGLL